MLLNRNLRRKPFLKCNYNWIIMIIVISNLGKCLQSLYKKCFFQNYIKEIALTCKLHKAYMTQCSSAFTLLLHCFVFIPFTLPPALSYSNIHTWGALSIVSLTDTHTYAQNSVIRRYSVFHSFALKSLLNSHLSFLSCWCKCPSSICICSCTQWFFCC